MRLRGKRRRKEQFLGRKNVAWSVCKEVGPQNRWQWLRNETLKRETESLIFAAQEQAIRTNVIKGKIGKLQEQTKCRMCSRTDETINHIVSECPKLAQKSTKKGMIGSGGVLIGKFVKQMESMLNRNRMSINQIWSLRMTHVRYFGILLYRQTI